MSEHNPFESLGKEEGLDVAAIFGGGVQGSDTNPFETAPVPASAAEPLRAEEPEQPKQSIDQPAVAEQPARPETPTPVEEQPQPPAPAAPAANPLQAALEEKAAQEQKAVAQSLFEKAPVFSYGSAKDPISDGAMTFEELRIAKSEDFPELAEGKRVSWSVEYGKITKQITDPKGKTIQSIKEEIERSKEFLEGLKKAKDKNPDCLVKPRVTAQSKGIAAYKGVFASMEDARASDKTICLIPAADGKVYEMRKTEMGDFIAPKDNIVDFQAVRAGFTPALPRIPNSLLQQIISFFRCYMEESREFEALAHILWDKEQEVFIVYVPPQQVFKARVEASLPQDRFSESRYIHYADIHSHNSMEAKFSSIDNADERATRIYAVMGRLDKFFPDLTVRMSCGGSFLELDPSLIFEGVGEEFPQEWRENVQSGQRLRIPGRACRIDPHFAADKEFFVPGESL